MYGIIVGYDTNRFPVLNLYSREAARINADIVEKCITGANAYGKADFYYAVHGDVLSLIVCLLEGGTYSSYQTYQLNIKTGEPVSNKTLLKMAGIKETELSESLRRKIIGYYDGYDFIDYAYWDEFFDSHDIQGYEFDSDEYPFTIDGRLYPSAIDDHVSLVRRQALRDLQDIERLQLYWSAQNRLIAIIKLSGLGGALYYEVLMDHALSDDAYSKHLSDIRGGWDILA